MKRRKLTALLMAALMLASVTACGGAPAASQEAEPPDLTGVWEQANDAGNGYIQKAQIQGDVMEVYWIDSDTDTEALYWAGSFTPPETAEEPYTWTSENDTEKTGYAIMASTSDTKDFTYNAGKISYEVSIQGVSWTVELKKVEGAVPDIDTGDSSADSSEAVTEQPDAEPAETAYEVGDTWTVDGQWELTVTGVEEVEPSQYDDDPPAVLYKVSYSYTNLGYDDGVTEGLYLALNSGSVVDSTGVMGEEHYGDEMEYPDYAPVGATCDAVFYVGLDNPGAFSITLSEYDSEYNLHRATFQLDPQGGSAPAEGGETGETGGSDASQTGGTVTLGELTLTLPDQASYTEMEPGAVGQIVLEEGKRQATIIVSDLDSFGAEDADILNRMMIAAALEGIDVLSQDDYTMEVVGETAQVSICDVNQNDVSQVWTLVALFHNGTQYLFNYAITLDAAGDSTDFFDMLETATFAS